MKTRIRLLLALSLLTAGFSVTSAAPAHACFNPDEPTCQIRRATCNATEPVAKYRDKVMICYP